MFKQKQKFLDGVWSWIKTGYNVSCGAASYVIGNVDDIEVLSWERAMQIEI